mmetsp:Transcript_20674/g.49327  ORF Transcript_20674/g.49327 Transcript_20674/m.49327 type:complete len:311 (+) Transcript_20674:195-1127(+)
MNILSSHPLVISARRSLHLHLRGERCLVRGHCVRERPAEHDPLLHARGQRTAVRLEGDDHLPQVLPQQARLLPHLAEARSAIGPRDHHQRPRLNLALALVLLGLHPCRRADRVNEQAPLQIALKVGGRELRHSAHASLGGGSGRHATELHHGVADHDRDLLHARRRHVLAPVRPRLLGRCLLGRGRDRLLGGGSRGRGRHSWGGHHALGHLCAGRRAGRWRHASRGASEDRIRNDCLGGGRAGGRWRSDLLALPLRQHLLLDPHLLLLRGILAGLLSPQAIKQTHGQRGGTLPPADLAGLADLAPRRVET